MLSNIHLHVHLFSNLKILTRELESLNIIILFGTDPIAGQKLPKLLSTFYGIVIGLPNLVLFYTVCFCVCESAVRLCIIYI